MRKQLYKLKGLDLRSNPLYRREGAARDLANVRLDHSGNLLKREDFTASNIPRGADGELGSFLDKLPFTTTIIGMIEDYSDDYTLLICLDEDTGNSVQLWYKWFPDSNTVEKILPNSYTTTIPTMGVVMRTGQIALESNLSYQIQNNILYVTGRVPQDAAKNPDGLAYIYKYDGENYHVSGVSKVSDDISDDTPPPAGGLYLRAVPFTVDDQGRFTFGDYTSERTTQVGFDQQYNFSAVSDLDEIRSVCEVTSNVTKNLTGVDRTFAYVNTNTWNISAGQYVLYAKGSYDIVSANPTGIYRFLIESVDHGAGNVTFSDNYQVYGEDGWEDTTLTSSPFDLRSGVSFSAKALAIYTSNELTTGFELFQVRSFSVNVPITDTIGISFIDPSLFGPIATNFEDFYAETFVKALPPRTNGSLAIYRDTLITHDKDFIYLSDNYSGGNQEDFIPSDSYLIGKSAKGNINAVFANETFVAVFRESGAYYLSGNVITGQFRDLAYRSTDIGCLSAAGIVDLAGGCYFPSKRGFHLAQPSGRLNDISDNIEPLFIDNILGYFPNISNSVSKIDFNREYILSYIPTSGAGSNIVLLYSYYHNEWFLYLGLNMDGGFYVKDGLVYYSDGNDVYVESAARVNSIDAYYRGNFEIMGDAALWKKFLRTKIYTIGSDDTELSIKTYSNWDEDDDTGLDETEIIGQGDNFCVQRFPKTNSNIYSLSMEFGSDGINPLLVNGYELEFAMEQTEYDDTKPQQ